MTHSSLKSVVRELALDPGADGQVDRLVDGLLPLLHLDLLAVAVLLRLCLHLLTLAEDNGQDYYNQDHE